MTRVGCRRLLKVIGLGVMAIATLSPLRGASATKSVADVLTPLPLGSARLGGRVGHELDTLLQARYLSDFAQKEVYPETEEALRQRVDDTIWNKRGYWQGEFWGKWMLGAIAAQRYTGSPELKDFIRQACRAAIATQSPNGYIGTYSKTDTTKGWNIWGMKYTLWALVEAYELLGDPAILAAARRQMDYLMTFVGPGKTNIAQTGECHGFPSSSILQPLVLLHRHTGDQRYLDYARYIVGQWSSPDRLPGILAKGLSGQPLHDWFPRPDDWAKAYELMHCVEGLLELYRTTGQADYLRAAQNITDDIIRHERTIAGNISLNDKLDHAPLKPDAFSEVCDAVYYERLCAELLRLTGNIAYAHELERTLYNSLCGSMNAAGSWGARRLSLAAPHLTAPKHCWLEHQQCCVANAPRGFLQIAEYAVMTAPDSVTINLYLPGTYHVTLPKGSKLELECRTDYPKTGTINIRINPAQTGTFTLALRIPDWSAQNTLSLNGEPQPGVTPDRYYRINRRWQAGDCITLELDMRGRVTRFSDSTQKFVAVERGPLVLARDTVLQNTPVTGAVALAAANDGHIALQEIPAPKGFWMAFAAPLAGGGTLPMCDYASTGEPYKQQIADLGAPPKPGQRFVPPQQGKVPAGMEDFRVWLPAAEAR